MSAKLAEYASHWNSDKMRLTVTVNFPLMVLHTGDMLSVDGHADAAEEATLSISNDQAKIRFPKVSLGRRFRAVQALLS